MLFESLPPSYGLCWQKGITQLCKVLTLIAFYLSLLLRLYLDCTHSHPHSTQLCWMWCRDFMYHKYKQRKGTNLDLTLFMFIIKWKHICLNIDSLYFNKTRKWCLIYLFSYNLTSTSSCFPQHLGSTLTSKNLMNCYSLFKRPLKRLLNIYIVYFFFNSCSVTPFSLLTVYEYNFLSLRATGRRKASPSQTGAQTGAPLLVHMNKSTLNLLNPLGEMWLPWPASTDI